MNPDMEVPVLVLDLDETEAAKLLVTLDPLAAMAQPDQDKLLALLRDVQFNSQAVNNLLTAVANGETMPLAPLTPEDAVERGECVCGACGNRHNVNHASQRPRSAEGL